MAKRKVWPISLRWELIEKQDFRCPFCHEILEVEGDPMRYPTVEHVVPLCRGGADNITNIVMACLACNWRRNAVDQEQRGW